MFETGIRQFRMAMGMVWNRRLDTRNIARLVDDALATLAEFGEPGADAQTLTDGPLNNPEMRLQIAGTNVRRTAARLDAQSPFYARRFAAAEVNLSKLDIAGLRGIPVTVKGDLNRQPDDFHCADAPRHLATRTTGTTGRPTEIWLSRYEMELWPAMGALASILRDDFRPTDVMQVHVSSRATAAVNLDAAVCRLVGTGCRLIGLVPADEALDSLGDGTVTLLSTTPSYLGELVVAARKRGMGPADFKVRRIDVGGEVLSPSLTTAALETFGAERISDLFGMTEVLPVTGRTCGQGHLHHDINTGHVEYLDLETGEPAEPGALATVVITPFFPYRDCTPVFRYDTRDVVRCMDNSQPLTCEVQALPATSKVLGKADQLMRLGPTDTVTPRQLVEAIEALPSQPWPARFRASVSDGRLSLTLPEYAIDGVGHADAVRHFADNGLDVDLSLVADDEARSLRQLRCDLRETTFAARPALIGA